MTREVAMMSWIRLLVPWVLEVALSLERTPRLPLSAHDRWMLALSRFACLLDLRGLLDWAVARGLAAPERRPLLLDGLPPEVVAALPVHDRPLLQLFSDLRHLRGIPGALALWLVNAQRVCPTALDGLDALREALERRAVEAGFEDEPPGAWGCAQIDLDVRLGPMRVHLQLVVARQSREDEPPDPPVRDVDPPEPADRDAPPAP